MENVFIQGGHQFDQFCWKPSRQRSFVLISRSQDLEMYRKKFHLPLTELSRRQPERVRCALCSHHTSLSHDHSEIYGTIHWERIQVLWVLWLHSNCLPGRGHPRIFADLVPHLLGDIISLWSTNQCPRVGQWSFHHEWNEELVPSCYMIFCQYIYIFLYACL